MIRQHHKGKARPRGWHRGRAAGRVNERSLVAFEALEARAATAEREVEAMIALHRDEVALWRALEHVAPYVPSW